MSIIVFKLTEEMDRFKTKTGRMPTRLYLGHDEHDLLVHEASQFVMVPEKAWTQRLNWNGIPVYSVDAGTHLGFGVDAPAQ